MFLELVGIQVSGLDEDLLSSVWTASSNSLRAWVEECFDLITRTKRKGKGKQCNYILIHHVRHKFPPTGQALSLIRHLLVTLRL